MLIRCWGARGSVPVSGPEYLKYGGDTTCIEIRADSGHVIIVDAGSGIRRLGKKLSAEDKNDLHLLFTHVHWDHVLGFPFFEPIYHRSTRLNVYGCSYLGDSIKKFISPAMAAPYFPVNYDDIAATITYHDCYRERFRIGSVEITPIPLSHPNGGVGYKFEENDRAMVFLTDNELGYPHYNSLDYNDYVLFAQGVDLVIHDAEFSRADYRQRVSWGHSCYEDTVEFAIKAGVGSLGLFHHNQNSSDDRVDSYLAHSKQLIDNAGSGLTCFALYQGREIDL